MGAREGKDDRVNGSGIAEASLLSGMGGEWDHAWCWDGMSWVWDGCERDAGWRGEIDECSGWIEARGGAGSDV